MSVNIKVVNCSEITNRFKTGDSIEEIAEETGLCKSLVEWSIRAELLKHLTPEHLST